jgi:protein SCO1/2
MTINAIQSRKSNREAAMPARFFRIHLPAAALALAFSASAFAALFSREARDIHAELDAARRENRRLVIFFELPDCPGCLEMKRQVFSSVGVEKEFERAYRGVRVDLGSASLILDAQGVARAVRDIAGQWRIHGAPSFAFFSADGQLEYRFTGALTHPADFLRLGRYVAEADYEERPFSDYLRSSIEHSSHGH